MANPLQDISFHAFSGTAEGILAALKREPLNTILRDRDPFRQLNYIADYLNYPEINAASFICEDHYVDRDFMEDHGVFYSRALHSYENYCKRLHFFSIAKEDLVRHAREVTGPKWNEVRKELSEAYLGFLIVKPLQGAPVGRTVLKHLPQAKGDGHLRSFRCTREYHVHVLGTTLTVRGLAFQQQDEGVSACATTAIWSSLQKIRDFEDIRVATPAEITMLASRHTLPFGRAMPQEGLSIDQMCQAINAVGLAPMVYRPEAPDDLLAYVHSIERSGFPSILIWADNAMDATRVHAVTVVGVKKHPDSSQAIGNILDNAQQMRAIYVHDDRTGPYLRADINANRGRLYLKVPIPGSSAPEDWYVSHVIVPVHPKIRLSFASLRSMARKFIVAVQQAVAQPATTLEFETYMSLGHIYIQDLCGNASEPALRALGAKLVAECAMPRYVGVIHVQVVGLGWIDLLLDTTSTTRSVEFVALACNAGTSPAMSIALSKLAGIYGCGAYSTGG